MQPDELIGPVEGDRSRSRCQHRTRDDGISLVAVLTRAGIPPERAFILECEEVHWMALLIARSGSWAKGERTLIAEIPTPPLSTPTWLSMHRAGVTIAGAILAFVLCLLSVWQIA